MAEAHDRGSTPRARIGVVAHDAKKNEPSLFIRAHTELFAGAHIVAPEDTARILEETRCEVRSLARDSHGGDIQLAAAVVDGVIDGVIFLRDPLLQLSGEPAIEHMMRVCDLENVPIATNLAAALILVRHLQDVQLGVATTGQRAGFETHRGGQVVHLSNHPSGRGRRARFR